MNKLRIETLHMTIITSITFSMIKTKNMQDKYWDKSTTQLKPLTFYYTMIQFPWKYYKN